MEKRPSTHQHNYQSNQYLPNHIVNRMRPRRFIAHAFPVYLMIYCPFVRALDFTSLHPCQDQRVSIDSKAFLSLGIIIFNPRYR